MTDPNRIIGTSRRLLLTGQWCFWIMLLDSTVAWVDNSDESTLRIVAEFWGMGFRAKALNVCNHKVQVPFKPQWKKEVVDSP